MYVSLAYARVVRAIEINSLCFKFFIAKNQKSLKGNAIITLFLVLALKRNFKCFAIRATLYRPGMDADTSFPE